MFRSITIAALAFALAALAACSEAPPPRTASSNTLAAPPPAGAAVPLSPTAIPAVPPATPRPIPAPATASDESPLLGTAGASFESCRERCDRDYRVCGDSAPITSEDRSRPLDRPRLFSPADDCQQQLQRCERRCSSVN